MKTFKQWGKYFGMEYVYDNKNEAMSKDEFAKKAKTLKLIKGDSNGAKLDELHSMMGGF